MDPAKPTLKDVFALLKNSINLLTFEKVCCLEKIATLKHETCVFEREIFIKLLFVYFVSIFYPFLFVKIKVLSNILPWFGTQIEELETGNNSHSTENSFTSINLF